MSHLRYLEGYAVVVHSRAGAYPLQGWFERRQTSTLQHPALKQGAGSPRPPRRAGGWVPRATAIGGSGRGEGVIVPVRSVEGFFHVEEDHHAIFIVIF